MGASDRKLALEKLKVRAEMRSAGDEEDSSVIEQEALSRAPKSDSTPPRAKAIGYVLKLFPPNSRPWVFVASLAMLLAALAYSGALTALVEWARTK